MFLSKDSKIIATKIAASASDIRDAIAAALEQSVVGRDEVPFITALTENLPPALDGALWKAGLAAHTRTVKIHQKPKVRYRNSAGIDVSCELGDLLFVVKYFLPGNVFEAKSVIHQVKSSIAVGDARCVIDPVQLELLQHWPSFSFGRTGTGGPQTYAPNPWTLEFGSYMLMRRRPDLGQYLGNFRRDYGVVPSAWRVENAVPPTVNMTDLPFTLLAAAGLFNHVAFMNGESHANTPIAQLIEALYRYVNWEPDPPNEFDGYYNDYTNRTDEGVFAVIEVRIALAQSDEAIMVKKIAPPQRGK